MENFLDELEGPDYSEPDPDYSDDDDDDDDESEDPESDEDAEWDQWEKKKKKKKECRKRRLTITNWVSETVLKVNNSFSCAVHVHQPRTTLTIVVLIISSCCNYK